MASCGSRGNDATLKSPAKAKPAACLVLAAVMATLLHSESRRLYSWWWDSHNSPKNSKWLQENLTDMDSKVKAMIKLIEEDADSFARRAEMYYKKRPELMKLVEEFYRAYRALAERYNHATGELRQAHRTMAQAFPDQVPFALADDVPSGSESDNSETPHPIRSLLNPDFQGTKRNGACSDEPNNGNGRKGLKQINDMFRSAVDMTEELISEDGKTKAVKISNVRDESEGPSEGETELQSLKEALAKFEAERNSILLQYQEALDRLSILERDVSNVRKDSESLKEQKSEAETEIQALQKILKSLEAERETLVLEYKQALERVAAFESLLTEAQEDSKELRERLAKAELESYRLKQELAKLEDEKKASELLYLQCLEKIAGLEIKLAESEKCLKLLAEQSEKAENEVKSLKEEIRIVSFERDSMTTRYEESLGTISELQKQLLEAQEENAQLKSEVLLGLAELKRSEDERVPLVKINESLQMEAKTLAQKIVAADEELSQKQAELDKLMLSLKEEHSLFVEAENKLHTLRNMHSQSQEEQRALSFQLGNVLETMKDLEMCKRDLQAEVERLKEENYFLSDFKSSSSISEENLQTEILRLREVKEMLEAEVRHQTDRSDDLEAKVQDLKDEIHGSNKRYQALVQQLESVGLDPESFGSLVKGLQDENLRLKERNEKNKADKEVLLGRLEGMDELLMKNKKLENSLSVVNAELERSKENSNNLQGSCNDLTDEKSALFAEKSAILSQLQIITETMQSLLEKNTSLQTSLCGANSELEGLRAKSRGLEEFCQLLTSERSTLLDEKSSLLSRLEIVEQKMEKLELRFTNLEDKYFGIEKDKESTLGKVEELRITLDIEKQERVCLKLTEEARLSGLEGWIHELREENKCRKNEFEEQLEKAVDAQVEIFILQKFVQDMEDKNYSLLVECQKHVERAQYSEKLITELESENMIQQVEAEYLLGKIDSLRAGINQVLKALGIKHGTQGEHEQNFLPCVLANIGDIKKSLLESKDENHQLCLEKSILSTLLAQIQVECQELALRKAVLEQESVSFTKQLLMIENEKCQLVDTSRQLKLEISERERKEEALIAAVENLLLNQKQLQEANSALKEECVRTFDLNGSLEAELLRTEGDKKMFEEENSVILSESLALNLQCMILKRYGDEKAFELNEIVAEMEYLGKAYKELEDVAIGLEERLLVREVENLTLKVSLEKLEERQHELSSCNDQLILEISNDHILLNQKEKDLEEAELKLKVTQEINSELCSSIHCLEKDQEDLEVTRTILEKQIVMLSEHNNCQKDELLHLREANENLECEVSRLHENIEECKIKEVILTSELHERSSEFELWEAEAASFYFDLQISSVREILYQNKVQDLGSLCEDLEEVTSRRSLEIENMKLRVTTLENEAEALKTELTTCLPLIASLKNNVELLERNPVLQSKLHETITTDEQENCGSTERSSTCSRSLSELQKLQSRIKVIETILNKEKETAAKQENKFANIRLEAALKEIKDLKSQINKNNLQEQNRYSARESVCEASVVKIGEEMKDIPLDQASGRSFHGTSQRGSATSDDQMLELWEAAEQDCLDGQLISEVLEQRTDTMEDEIEYAPNETGYDPIPESHFEKELGVDKLEIQRSDRQSIKKSKKNARERLVSDNQKLMSLQDSVQELKRKMEPKKTRKKAEDPQHDTFRGQIHSVESSLVQLIEMNNELMKMTEESSMPCDRRVVGEVEEQAREEAEKISRLELEMQRMQYVLLRLKDEKKGKSKDAVSNSSAAVVLREFFYSRGRKSKKPKKSRFCGCFKPASAQKI
ncbi:hypothetical protein KSS87_007026 [Heliosperma pusillum]|nr:hypothetical protein KSS87_007026 [Heliosperma pusillum]